MQEDEGTYPAFPPDYAAARSVFRDLVVAVDARLWSLTIDAPPPRAANGPLTIDIAWVGARRPARALVHVSGLHGVEGFAGSAIQSCALKDLAAGTMRVEPDTAFILMHAVNPFGMAWNRRCNEHNVDLNRNCLPPEQSYAGAPPLYERLRGLLKPAGGSRRSSYAWFLTVAAWNVLRFGYPALAQAIAGGQYEYPDELFFGGKHLEPSMRLVFQWAEENLSEVPTLRVIDVHTGLGRFATDALLVPHPDDSSVVRDARRRLGTSVIVKGESPTAYSASGSMCRAWERLLPACAGRTAIQEFGTYHPLRVLFALSEENRLWHHSPNTPRGHAARRRLCEVFVPHSKRWRGEVLKRGLARLAWALCDM